MARSLISWAALLTALSITPALAGTKPPAAPSATETVTNLLNQDARAYGRKTAAQHAPPTAPAARAVAAKPRSGTPSTSFVFHTMPKAPTPVPPPKAFHARPKPVVVNHPVVTLKAPKALPPVRQATVSPPTPTPTANSMSPRLDPFKGQSVGYEHLLKAYRRAQIRAKIAQQRYNRMRFEKQMDGLGGMPGASAPPETAAIRRLQATVASLQAHIQSLTQHMVHTRTERTARRRRGALHLVAVMRGDNRRSAVLQWGHTTQTVHAGDVVGHFWVRAVHPHSIVLAGPHRLHILTMTSAVGSVAAESPVSTGGHPGGAEPVSDTGNNPLMALNNRLAQMAHQPSLPPP